MITDGLHVLERLHRLRNHRAIARTITELLHTTRAHAALALRPAGHQVLANVQRLCELARAFEAGGGLSFRAFVDLLQGDSGIRRAETTVLEEGADGVRLMTVHGAKGLEFPVVFLADLTCKAAAAQPDKYVDVDSGLAAFSVLGCRPWELIEHQEEELKRDQAEGLRLAYVAATRARDLLVVPAVGDAERDGWLAVLNKALYPPADRRRQAQRAGQCPCPPARLRREHGILGPSWTASSPGRGAPGRLVRSRAAEPSGPAGLRSTPKGTAGGRRDGGTGPA
jgi:ATP-dependent exoDNAse (exonuclease V) beta subunit